MKRNKNDKRGNGFWWLVVGGHNVYRFWGHPFGRHAAIWLFHLTIWSSFLTKLSKYNMGASDAPHYRGVMGTLNTTTHPPTTPISPPTNDPPNHHPATPTHDPPHHHPPTHPKNPPTTHHREKVGP